MDDWESPQICEVLLWVPLFIGLKNHDDISSPFNIDQTERIQFQVWLIVLKFSDYVTGEEREWGLHVKTVFALFQNSGGKQQNDCFSKKRKNKRLYLIWFLILLTDIFPLISFYTSCGVFFSNSFFSWSRSAHLIILFYLILFVPYPVHVTVVHPSRPGPHERTNQKARGRSVAKEEVWLSLRAAAIQRRWLKRLDCERRPEHFLWNLKYFATARSVIRRWRHRRRLLLGLSGDHRSVNKTYATCVFTSLPRQRLLALRAKQY